jgi:hypothetical protein
LCGLAHGTCSWCESEAPNFPQPRARVNPCLLV